MPIPKLLTALSALAAVIVAAIIGYVVLQPPGSLLKDATFSKAQISPNADGIDDIVTIQYSLSRTADISIYLDNEAGIRYYFREQQRRTAGDYSVLFSGVVDGFLLPDETVQGTIERRLIPSGTYTWTIEAVDDDGETTSETGTLTISDADSALPEIAAFDIHPSTFTPNQDGIDDRVSVNVYLTKASNLQVYLEDINGEQYYLPEREEGREPGEAGNHEFDYDGGVDQGMEPPPDGVYIVYAVTQDDEGQRIVQEGSLTIQDGGLPQAEIIAQITGPSVAFETQPYDDAYYSDLTTTGETFAKPEELTAELETITMPQDDLLVFKLTVYNYGSTPVRTAGPFPGTVYDFNQRAASLGEYEESGAWRVGINCDTAYSDFPWRWGLGDPSELEIVTDAETGETYYYLQPGQRAEVWGAIRMTEVIESRNPQDCWAGLIHEDVTTYQSRVGAKEIELVPTATASE